MKKQVFEEKNLPLSELEKYGLAEKGQILLDSKDVQAILEGRRSDMIRIYNVSENSETLKQVDVKVSAIENDKGKMELVFHPLYKEAAYPDFLTDVEAGNLQKGETVNITKKIIEDGKPKQVVVEFDAATNEFVVTDSRRIQAPDMMNYEYLSDAQKELFRNGKAVELSDGTKFRYSGTDRLGIQANRIALIASILFDGGISYLLYTGIKALTKNATQGTEREAYTEGYLKALENYNLQEQTKQKERLNQDISSNVKDEQSQSYGRSGVKR